VFYVCLIHGICPENIIFSGDPIRRTAGRVSLANVSSGMHYLPGGYFQLLEG
jgi:hypothetical protein